MVALLLSRNTSEFGLGVATISREWLDLRAAVELERFFLDLDRPSLAIGEGSGLAERLRVR